MFMFGSLSHLVCGFAVSMCFGHKKTVPLRMTIHAYWIVPLSWDGSYSPRTGIF